MAVMTKVTPTAKGSAVVVSAVPAIPYIPTNGDPCPFPSRQLAQKIAPWPVRGPPLLHSTSAPRSTVQIHDGPPVCGCPYMLNRAV